MRTCFAASSARILGQPECGFRRYGLATTISSAWAVRPLRRSDRCHIGLASPVQIGSDPIRAWVAGRTRRRRGSADSGPPMSVAGLIVAGGSGERMQRSGALHPKPLVPIRGVALLERNLIALLRAGIMDIHIAVSSRADGVGDFARSRCRKVVETLGAKLSVITEAHPLGSIGASAYLRDRAEILVVNADNLTSLDLRSVLAKHREAGATLTLAVHDEPFSIPFGEICMDGDRVTAYREKPSFRVRVCSAISVLSPDALAAFDPGETIGLPALANRLLSRNAAVCSFFHDAPWIDVNDMTSIDRAEELVRNNAPDFEHWSTSPDDQVVALLCCSHRGVALVRSPDGMLRLPAVAANTGGMQTSSILQALGAGRRSFPSDIAPIALFDDIDTDARRIIRTRLFLADIGDDLPEVDIQWVHEEAIAALDDIAPMVARALAAKARPEPAGWVRRGNRPAEG